MLSEMFGEWSIVVVWCGVVWCGGYNCYIRRMLVVLACWLTMDQRKAGLKVGSPGPDLGQLSGQYHEDINHGFYFCYS